jgi:hypothetical protein
MPCTVITGRVGSEPADKFPEDFEASSPEIGFEGEFEVDLPD